RLRESEDSQFLRDSRGNSAWTERDALLWRLECAKGPDRARGGGRETRAEPLYRDCAGEGYGVQDQGGRRRRTQRDEVTACARAVSQMQVKSQKSKVKSV